MSLKAAVLGFARRIVTALLPDSVTTLSSDLKRARQYQLETRLVLRRIEESLAKGKEKQGAKPSKPKSKPLGAKVPMALEAGGRNTNGNPEHAGSPTPAVPMKSALQALETEIAVLDACPVCGYASWTQVCEYNKFLLMDNAPDSAAALRYDYAMCHGCGIVFARRRPIGERYRYLLDRFEEAIGRVATAEHLRGKMAMSSSKLSEEDGVELRARAARGVFVSEDSGVSNKEYIPALLADRLGNSAHIELLTSLLDLDSPRVLELRPRFGSIGAALKRLCNAEVWGLPLFEGQQLLNREVYGHHVDHLLDYESFSIPYEGSFDLIVANHMVTHAVRPREVLNTIHDRLSPRGHLYLYNEPDDAGFLEEGKSMFNVLNPFHLQTFDRDSLLRGLRISGFEPTFVTHTHGNLVVLANRRAEPEPLVPLSDAEVRKRLGKYRAARDMAILRVPERLRSRFADEWDEVVERAFLAGSAKLTPEGTLRVIRGSEAEPDD